MNKLVLDAGPLIGFFFKEDKYHTECIQGFRQLSQTNTVLLTPLPIIFEVYKWLLYKAHPDIAKSALANMMETLKPIYLNQQMLQQIRLTLNQNLQWKGSLEDATVMLTAVQFDCPIWSYNYRDFNTFKTAYFWNPSM